MVFVPSLAQAKVAGKYRAEDAPAPEPMRPLIDARGLRQPKRERVLQLRHAEVVLADYALVRADFGDALGRYFEKPKARVTETEIDAWLLRSAGYVARTQAGQTAVNTAIPTNNVGIIAYRPYEYGRALVFEPEKGVLIDVKGAGARRPTQKGTTRTVSPRSAKPSASSRTRSSCIACSSTAARTSRRSGTMRSSMQASTCRSPMAARIAPA